MAAIYTVQVVGESVPTSDDFDIAFSYAVTFGERAQSLLAFARYVATGGRFSERIVSAKADKNGVVKKGTKKTTKRIDAIDEIAETVLTLEADYERARAAIEGCAEPLAIQNDRVTERRNDTKPTFDGNHYNSAHEALISLGCSLATAFRCWDYDPGNTMEVVTATHRPPLNVAKIRRDQAKACQWIVEQECAIDDATIKQLLADAGQECRQAKGAANMKLEEHDRQKALAVGAAEPSFVPNELQRRILNALEGCALKKVKLATEVCAGEGSRLYRSGKKRIGDLNELMDLGLVANKDDLGFYRPDAPPA